MKTFSAIRKSEQFPDRISRDVFERRKLRLLSRWLYRMIGNTKSSFLVTEDDLQYIFNHTCFAQRVFALSGDSPGEISQSNLKGLAGVIMSNYRTDAPFRFVSFASNALNDDGSLRRKDQYLKFDVISDLLKNTFGSLPYTYEIFLADVDFRFPLNACDRPWLDNLAYIKTKTKVNVLRLSDIFPDYQTFIDNANVNKGEKFDVVTAALQASHTLDNFGMSSKRARFQMALYCAIGTMLEYHFPTALILDVQRRIYPYEQPYYQAMRLSPLPVIRSRYLW